VHGGGVYLQGASREAGLDAELVEQGQHGVDVFDAGDVVERGLARCQERGGDELQGRVLRPRNLDLALQPFITLDIKSLGHGSSPVRTSLPVR
jgi:hypothetical protein